MSEPVQYLECLPSWVFRACPPVWTARLHCRRLRMKGRPQPAALKRRAAAYSSSRHNEHCVGGDSGGRGVRPVWQNTRCAHPHTCARCMPRSRPLLDQSLLPAQSHPPPAPHACMHAAVEWGGVQSSCAQASLCRHYWRSAAVAGMQVVSCMHACMHACMQQPYARCLRWGRPLLPAVHRCNRCHVTGLRSGQCGSGSSAGRFRVAGQWLDLELDCLA